MTQANEPPGFEHERVVLHHGTRSGLPVIVAVHSTRLGAAVGGTRMWNYPHWSAALSDALRLSSAMSLKNAAAGLHHGGGKAVIALPPDTVLSQQRRTDVMRDLGDVVESLDGALIVGEDVGTTSQDMLVIREQTRWAGGLPTEAGGTGEPADPTAVGVYAAIVATGRHAFGTAELQGRRVCIVGLGQVGERLARRLAAEGIALVLSDIDASKRRLAGELGADWAEPAEAMFVKADLLVPAALGGVLSAESVRRLLCSAIVGPANNQLADDGVARLLADRGILWAPNFIANAGGVVFGVQVSIEGKSAAEAQADVHQIGDRLSSVFVRAAQPNVTPYEIAIEDARARIAASALAAERG